MTPDWDKIVKEADEGSIQMRKLLTAVFGPPSETVQVKYALYDAQNAPSKPPGATIGTSGV
jgi:hypothetical protein